MENRNFYKEYSNPNSSISFVSKTRSFFERHFGVAASKTSYFFKRLGKGFKDRFVIEEEPVVEEPVVEEPVEEVQYTTVDKNKELFAENVKLAHIIDDLIKENKSVDLEEELSHLKVIVNQLNNANKENNYLELGRINNKLRVLNTRVLEKIEKNNTKLIPVTAVTIEHTDDSPFIMDTKKEEKEEKTNPFVMDEEKNAKKEEKTTKKEEKKVEISALIVKEPVKVNKTIELSKIKSKLSLFDRKIAALESKVALSKKPVKEIVGHITKIDKILNEENLDSREIRLYKELRDDRIAELNKALAKRDEAIKELEKVKVEKALYEQSNIVIDVPQKNGKVFRKEIRVKDYLEQKEREAEFEKAKKEQVKREKLEKEIAALKAKLAEKEAKLNAMENDNDTIGYNSKVETNYTPEEYHELIVNMHRESFY